MNKYKSKFLTIMSAASLFVLATNSAAEDMTSTAHNANFYSMEESILDNAFQELNPTSESANRAFGYQDGVGNSMNIQQEGGGNLVRASQIGNENRIDVRQEGLGHSAILEQTGYGNSIQLEQVGYMNSAELIQHGNMNSISLTQKGIGLETKITQHGNQQISIERVQPGFY